MAPNSGRLKLRALKNLYIGFPLAPVSWVSKEQLLTLLPVLLGRSKWVRGRKPRIPLPSPFYFLPFPETLRCHRLFSFFLLVSVAVKAREGSRVVQPHCYRNLSNATPMTEKQVQNLKNMYYNFTLGLIWLTTSSQYSNCYATWSGQNPRDFVYFYSAFSSWKRDHEAIYCVQLYFQTNQGTTQIYTRNIHSNRSSFLEEVTNRRWNRRRII